MFPLWLRWLPWYGEQTPVSVPPPAMGRSSPTNTPDFPPNSFVLPSFVSVHIFFSSGQALLFTLSWCSACTSVSEGVFLMYPWREMYSTPTYSYAISFFPNIGFCKIFWSRIFLWSQNLVCDFDTHILSLLENSEIITQPIVFWYVTLKIIFNICQLDFKIIFANCSK